MIRGELDRGRAELLGQGALMAWQHAPVSGGDKHSGRCGQLGEPRAAVEASQLASRLGDVDRVAARHLGEHPCDRILHRHPRDLDQGAPESGRGHPQRHSQQTHRAPNAANLGVVPLARGGTQHDPVEMLAVLARQQLDDRTAH